MDGPKRLTQVLLSEPGEVNGSSVRYSIALQSREEWRLRADVIPSADGVRVAVGQAERRFGDELSRVRSSLSAWHLSVPHLRASWEQLGGTFSQSVADLASLRMDEDPRVPGQLPAAGMPWFMTVFGRDTLITCLQTMLFGPELASNALRVLAALQATEDDPTIDAEPGKIVHEVRHGKGADAWFPRYYGSVDATPLYLVLLSEVWRWTGDAALVHDLREPAMRALRWIDEFGDLDGDGFVEYKRRSERGLVNQSWKDSGDSQRFYDGRLAEAPIAPGEVQGYVYDAKQRMAEAAREVWGDRSSPTGSKPRRPRSRSASTRPSGARRAAGTTRSRSMATRPASTRSRSNIGHFSGAASFRRRAPMRSSTSSWETSCGRAGGCERCPPATGRSTRSRTTTAPSGPMTTP